MDQQWFCAAEEISPPLAPSASHPSLDGQHIPIGVAESMLIALGIWPQGREANFTAPHHTQDCEGCWVVLIQPISSTLISHSGLWKGNPYPLEMRGPFSLGKGC